MNKFVLFAAVASLGAQASASFDLMYIPVANTDQVMRYDPINRVMLGGFFVQGVRRVMASGARFGAITTASASYRYDMVQGMNSGFATTSLSAASYDYLNDRILRPLSGSVFDYNPVTNSFTSTSLAGTSSLSNYGVGRFSNGTYTYLGYNSGTTSFTGSIHSTTGATLATFAPLTIPSGSFSNTIRWVNRVGTENITTAVRLGGTSDYRLIHFTRSAGGTLGLTFGATISSQFANSQPISLAPAHFGYYVVGSDFTSPSSLTRIQYYDNESFGGLAANWTISLNTSGNNNFGVGMVVAPEPGTMIALGAGVLALLKRRRRA